MSAMQLFLIALGVCLLLSTTLVLILGKPLRIMLASLCEGGEAIRFWSAFTAVMLYLSPLLVTLLVQAINDDGSAPLVQALRVAMTTAVLGAFLALGGVGRQIGRARPNKGQGAGSPRGEWLETNRG
jgi:hypothetical protein